MAALPYLTTCVGRLSSLPHDQPRGGFGTEMYEPDEAASSEILVAVANPADVENLIALAAALAWSPRVANARILALHVRQTWGAVPRLLGRTDPTSGRAPAVQRAVSAANDLGVAIQPVECTAHSAAAGILAIADSLPDLQLILLGWRAPTALHWMRSGTDQKVIRSAARNVAVLYGRQLNSVKRILVPVSGGQHARLGLRLARDLATSGIATKMTALRVLPPGTNEQRAEREEMSVRQLIRSELGRAARRFRIRAVCAQSVVAGVLNAAGEGYDLIIIGASERGFLRNRLLGNVPELVAERSPCSVLMVRREQH